MSDREENYELPAQITLAEYRGLLGALGVECDKARQAIVQYANNPDILPDWKIKLKATGAFIDVMLEHLPKGKNLDPAAMIDTKPLRDDFKKLFHSNLEQWEQNVAGDIEDCWESWVVYTQRELQKANTFRSK